VHFSSARGQEERSGLQGDKTAADSRARRGKPVYLSQDAPGQRTEVNLQQDPSSDLRQDRGHPLDSQRNALREHAHGKSFLVFLFR